MTAQYPGVTPDETRACQIGIDVGYREGFLKGLETALQIVAERNKDLNLPEVWSAVKKLRQDWEFEKAGLKKGDA